jgi:hypothetical protein
MSRKTRRQRGGTTPENRKRSRSNSSSRSRSRSKSPKQNKTKKLRINHAIEVQSYHLDTPEKQYKRGINDEYEIAQNQRKSSLNKCPSVKMMMDEDDMVIFKVPSSPFYYPCTHRGVIFEKADDYKEYYDMRAAKTNMHGVTPSQHYLNFPGHLNPSKKSREILKLKQQNAIKQILQQQHQQSV